MVDRTSSWSRYQAYLTATADTLVKPNSGGTASATSKATDPWQVTYRATASSRIHNVLLVSVGFGGSMRPRRRGQTTHSALELRGSMGQIVLQLNGQTGKLSCGVRLSKGWRAYFNVKFPKNGDRTRVPRRATIGELREFFLSKYDCPASGPLIQI